MVVVVNWQALHSKSKGYLCYLCYQTKVRHPTLQLGRCAPLCSIIFPVVVPSSERRCCDHGILRTMVRLRRTGRAGLAVPIARRQLQSRHAANVLSASLSSPLSLVSRRIGPSDTALTTIHTGTKRNLPKCVEHVNAMSVAAEYQRDTVAQRLRYGLTQWARSGYRPIARAEHTRASGHCPGPGDVTGRSRERSRERSHATPDGSGGHQRKAIRPACTSFCTFRLTSGFFMCLWENRGVDQVNKKKVCVEVDERSKVRTRSVRGPGPVCLQ